MNRLARWVVKHRKLIITAYALALIPSLAGYLLTGTNYDLLSYMPSDLESRQGQELLEEKFDLSGMGAILVSNKTFREIEELARTIKAVDGVEEVIRPGSFTDTYRPLDFLEPGVKEQFIYGDSVLMQVIFSENARMEKTSEAVREINRITERDDDILFGGEPSIINEMQETTDEDMIYYTAIAAVIIFIILTLSVRSYLDPFIFMLSMGVAVAINMGSNFFLGEISFLTASIAAVMQLGISLDYSIFLLHRFQEEKSRHASVETAMEKTIAKTAVTVASSAATTIGGFAALMIMQNGIGADMGLVLAKGIVISLVVNLTLLPGLLLAFHRLSDRLQHRLLLPSFRSISRWFIKGRWVFLVLLLLLVAPSFTAQEQVEYYYSNARYLPDTSPAAGATREIMDKTGAGEMVYVITEDRGAAGELRLAEEIKTVPSVEKVVSLSTQVDPALPRAILPPETSKRFTGEGYRYLQVFMSTFDHEPQGFAAVDRIREATATVFDHYYVAGDTALTRDMASISQTDSRNVTLASIAAVALIIALSFRSFTLPFFLILAIQAAIWLNLGLLHLQDQSVASLTPIIIGAIQLGATVDYAILFTLRYRDNIFLSPTRVEAARRALEETGPSILTSALTLFSATMSIALMASISATREMTMLIGRGAVISMTIIFLGLPSLLITFDRVIGSTTLGWPRSRNRAVSCPAPDKKTVGTIRRRALPAQTLPEVD